MTAWVSRLRLLQGGRALNYIPPDRLEDAAVLTLRSFPPQHVLRVNGTKPYTNMKVELVPLVYVKQPEYWGIEVVGSLRGIGLPALAPYSVSLPLAGLIGTHGIEVIGATRTERFDIQPIQQSPTDGHLIQLHS